ncbi:hypothetical protein R5R35_014326 [Gryllus longicercus]|uniref:Phospholipase n=1 Tax=Gryllus longicercus TaxID=2509291 RepID=A0AAN9VCM0_9ORTH
MTDTHINGSVHDDILMTPTSPDSDFDVLPTDHTDLGDSDGLSPGEGKENEVFDDPKVIPFRTIHNTPLKFKSPQRKVFIPNEDIQVKIVDYERSVTTHLLNPNLYVIQLTHGEFTWEIKKRYKHIQHLHQQLKIYRASLNVPFPTKAHRERRTSFRNDLASSSGDKKAKRSALPRFPNKPEALVPYEDVDKRKEQLQDYLNNLLKIRLYRNHHETVNFLEVSQLSFVKELGDKGKEGPILKRTGSTRPGQGSCNFCGLLDSSLCIRCKYICTDICGKWRNRWLFVKDTYMGYIRPKDGSVKCVLLFDGGFEVSSGIYTTSMSRVLQITNLSRQLVIKCWTRRKRKEWISCLKEIANGKAKEFTQKNRYNSFAPNRESMRAAWFVDGCTYMAAVADALESAEEEIFIADWWLSPEIYMKRPALGDTWRLDTILKRKAEEGVKIFVLLYKEVELAMGINSYYSKQRLACSHPNIKVLRHPDHAKAGVFLWAHHEKIVVIDQTYAFLGGIDLCYGRWDDYNHRLTDLGSVSQTLGPFLPSRRKQTSSRPLGEANHPHSLLHLAVASNVVSLGALGGSSPCLHGGETEETTDLEIPEPPPLQRTVTMASPAPDLVASEMPLENAKCDTPTMERRNIMDKVRQTTENAKSKGKEWIHWLYQSTDFDSSDEETQEVESGIQIAEPVEYNGNIPKEEHYINEDMPPADGEIMRYHSSLRNSVVGLSGMAKLWIGKDYTNFIVKDFQNLDLPYQDLVDRNTTPRMPWHDIGVMVQGAAARDVARHFIQRWNSVKLEKAKFSIPYPYLLPKSYNNLDNIKPVLLTPVRSVDCQVVRSLAQWSGGFLEPDTLEEGIHEAYVDIITNAKHYVYIENQFFITLASTSTSVRNQIGEALFKRILRAHKEQAVFRVFVIMPLLPGFEGEVGSPSGRALHAITHWNYSSICRGKEAILNRLKEAGISDPMEYISFYGLRTHSSLNGDPVSELIYVHSKLLIVDDNIVICGSANINDRSLLGKRDSEIAVVLKDCEFDDGVMNGNPYSSGKFAGSLRRYLFKEHLGILDARSPNDSIFDVRDPIIASFYHDTWRQIAAENTRIHEEVFHCLPSDRATNFSTLKKLQEEVPLSISDRGAAMKLLSGVQGHLVCLPLEFLKDEVLTPNAVTMEGIMPTSLWT